LGILFKPLLELPQLLQPLFNASIATTSARAVITIRAKVLKHPLYVPLLAKAIAQATPIHIKQNHPTSEISIATSL
jgi:hypothetical protein